ncbi:MAG: Cell division protein FtsL [Pseudomonadota bacterium]|jgi:cell division protein FtsL
MRPWILGVCLVVTALALVNARYHERRLFAQIEQTDRLLARLVSDAAALRVQLIALRAPSRLDRMAREQLGMEPIRPSDTVSLGATLP